MLMTMMLMALRTQKKFQCETPKKPKEKFYIKKVEGFDKLSVTQASSIQVLPVQQQKGAADCDCFVIAFAVLAAFSECPSQYTFKQGKMREHLRVCFEQGYFVTFPSTLKQARNIDSANISITQLEPLHACMLSKLRLPLWTLSLQIYNYKPCHLSYIEQPSLL